METNDLHKKIKDLAASKNAVILGHYYQLPEVQDVADFVGDSLDLSKTAKNTKADIIVFAGVKFMAETAKILNPSKKVLLPDMEAGCSLAESCPTEDFRKFKEEHPEHLVVSYINTTAEIKALSDVTCTSTNALEIINKIPRDKKIIFAPDKNLGNYINSLTGRDMLLWDGACHVHEEFSLEKMIELKDKYTKLSRSVEIIAHPECKKHILMIAGFVGSTSALLEYVQTQKTTTFIVATESGILHQMKQKCPDKNFIAALPIDSTCGCNDCNFMKLITLQKIYDCLLNETNEITIDEELRKLAYKPVWQMFKMTQKRTTGYYWAQLTSTAKWEPAYYCAEREAWARHNTDRGWETSEWNKIEDNPITPPE